MRARVHSIAGILCAALAGCVLDKAGTGTSTGTAGGSSSTTAGATSSGAASGSGSGGAAAVGSGASAVGSGGAGGGGGSGAAGSDIWRMGGVFVYDPVTFPASVYGPVLQANHFGWVAVQIMDGSTEKWPCPASPCGADAARGFIDAWKPYVAYVGAWGVNRANGSEGAVGAEAQGVATLLDSYAAAGSFARFYIADAEIEYEYSKCGNCVSASDWWTAKFRELKPAGTFDAALSSYGRVDLHDIDWMKWILHAWEGGSGPDDCEPLGRPFTSAHYYNSFILFLGST